MIETTQQIRGTAPRPSPQLTLTSAATRQPASRRHLITIAVLTALIALAATYLTAHGWSHGTREFAHLLAHLPKPLQVLLGGSRLAHVLTAAQ